MVQPIGDVVPFLVFDLAENAQTLFSKLACSGKELLEHCYTRETIEGERNQFTRIHEAGELEQLAKGASGFINFQKTLIL